MGNHYPNVSGLHAPSCRIMVRIDRNADLDAVRKGLSDVAARAGIELHQLMNPQQQQEQQEARDSLPSDQV